MSKIKVMNAQKFVEKFKPAFYGMYNFKIVENGEIGFTPTHKFLDFKLQHHITYFNIYNSKLDKTYLYLLDEGYIIFHDLFGLKNSNGYGVLVVIDGKFEIGEDAENISTELLTKIYNKKEEMIRSYSDEEDTKEEEANPLSDLKSFSDLYEEVAK
jgi:hypothetical protein